MDRDGESLLEEESRTGNVPTGLRKLSPGQSGNGLEGSSTAEEDNLAGDENDDEDDDDDEGDDDEDGSENGDTTDGAAPHFESKAEEVAKRPHIQSRRMREYHAMQLSNQGGKQWCCPHTSCKRTFNSAPGLRYHAQTHEPGNESFTCDNCCKKFKSHNGLKYHQKRKRCQGGRQKSGSNHTAASAATASKPSLVLPSGDPTTLLMDFANIATGPQSPLMRQSQSTYSKSQSRASGPDFDSTETSAAIALSSMAQKRSKDSLLLKSKSEEDTLPHPEETQQQQKQSKRPMNGFMLFAQKNRADFKKMHPNTNNRVISTKLSEKWNELPEDERQKWKEQAREMAEQRRRENPDCWKRKKFIKDGN